MGVIAFPDKGGYEKWRSTADNLNRVGFDIRVSKLLENKGYETGWDLVDVINNELKNSARKEIEGSPTGSFITLNKTPPTESC